MRKIKRKEGGAHDRNEISRVTKREKKEKRMLSLDAQSSTRGCPAKGRDGRRLRAVRMQGGKRSRHTEEEKKKTEGREPREKKKVGGKKNKVIG